MIQHKLPEQTDTRSVVLFLFQAVGERGASDQFLVQATARDPGDVIRTREKMLKEGVIKVTILQERSYTSKRWVAVYAINNEG